MFAMGFVVITINGQLGNFLPTFHYWGDVASATRGL